MSTTSLQLPHGTMTYEDVGTGPTLVFVHGAIVDRRLWREVVPRLQANFRCVALDLPLGAHRTATRPGTDVSPPGVARIVAAALEALDLRDVTLVGSDTGGGICQLVVAHHPERVRGLVLTNCDAYDVFPPKVFAPLLLIARRAPGLARQLLKTMPHRPARDVLAAPILKNRDAELERSWFTPAATDPGVARDLVQLLATIDAQALQAAAPRFRDFPGPVLLAWAPGDRLFPLRLAERLAADFPNAELKLLAKGRTFTPLDQPEALAGAIRAWAERHLAAPVAA